MLYPLSYGGRVLRERAADHSQSYEGEHPYHEHCCERVVAHSVTPFLTGLTMRR